MRLNCLRFATFLKLILKNSIFLCCLVARLQNCPLPPQKIGLQILDQCAYLEPRAIVLLRHPGNCLSINRQSKDPAEARLRINKTQASTMRRTSPGTVKLGRDSVSRRYSCRVTEGASSGHMTSNTTLVAKVGQSLVFEVDLVLFDPPFLEKTGR